MGANETYPSVKAVTGIHYFTPAQEPPAATPEHASHNITLFTPLRVRSLETHNRFVVSPMCQYSCEDGHLTDYHLVHLGQLAQRGAGLVMVEATAVEARGRISPEDSGLWKDSQIRPLRRVVDFVHSQGSKIAMQLAHAGRKASTLTPWLTGTRNKTVADETCGGWPDDVHFPSAIPFAEDYPHPKAMTIQDINLLVKMFAQAAERAVEAGVDAIEIHGAHGYLISSFLSPLSNKRIDDYGGTFDKRTRIVREVASAIRAVIPNSMPLWLRLSATEWMEWAGEPSWDLESTIHLAMTLPSLGIDVLDVSSGGNINQQQVKLSQTFQTANAKSIHAALRTKGIQLKVAAVGMINNAAFARDLVQDDEDPSADYVMVGRQFLREPEFVLRAAYELGIKVKWPVQYQYATF